jgi:type IV pilus assembly protein PilB
MDEPQDPPDKATLKRLAADYREYQRKRRVPLAKRSNGVNIIDFSDVSSLYPRLIPLRRLLLLVLLLAIKDRASEVRFEPSNSEDEGRILRLFFQVDGELHELVPPPAHLTEEIPHELKTIAGYDTIRRRFANLLRNLARKLDGESIDWAQSSFRMQVGEDGVDVVTSVHSSELGDRIFLGIPDGSESFRERAQVAIREFYELRDQSNEDASS